MRAEDTGLYPGPEFGQCGRERCDQRLGDRAGTDRPEALRLMTQRYIELMHANQPVHDWPDRP